MAGSQYLGRIKFSPPPENHPGLPLEWHFIDPMISPVHQDKVIDIILFQNDRHAVSLPLALQLQAIFADKCIIEGIFPGRIRRSVHHDPCRRGVQLKHIGSRTVVHPLYRGESGVAHLVYHQPAPSHRIGEQGRQGIRI